MADLVKQIKLPLTIDFMAVSSYGRSTHSSGVVRILKDPDEEIGKGRAHSRGYSGHRLTLNYLADNLYREIQRV